MTETGVSTGAPGSTVSGQTPVSIGTTGVLGSIVSGQTPGSTVSGQTTGSTVSGETPGSTVSAQTPGSTVSGQTSGSTISGQTSVSSGTTVAPSSTVSGQTPVSTVSEETPGSTFSGQTPGSTISGQTSGSYGTTVVPGSTVAGQTSGSLGTTSVTSFTTTEHCEQMQAVDENVSKNIIVQPNPLLQGDNIDFQITSSKGVSFPDNDRKPTIIVKFDQPAEVQSVTIPRDKTNGANVLQFEVVFYSPKGDKINEIPIESNLSPEGDKTTPAHLDSTQIPSTSPVSRIDITVIETINDESPKGVVLDINACTKARTRE
jgi:hypothetical protein